MTVLPEQMYRMARQASDEINKGASAYFVVLGVLGTALAQMTKEGQPTPGVYENYREPGEFGEGVTVRRTPPPVQHVIGLHKIDERAKEAGPVLILVDGHVIEATYNKEACEWVAGHWGLGFGEDPTHWMPLPAIMAETAATHVNGGAYRRVSRAEWGSLGGAANKFCDWHEGIGYVVYDEQARSEYRAKVATPSPQPRSLPTASSKEGSTDE